MSNIIINDTVLKKNIYTLYINEYTEQLILMRPHVV